jgi:D-alanine-D-alanine ligase
MHKRKLRVAIIFGGRSSEHEVSLLSAKTVLESLDKDRYDPILIAIDKAGGWHIKDPQDFLANACDPKKVALGGNSHPIAIVPGEGAIISLLHLAAIDSIDVAIPMLHGLNGEDGTVQGLLQLAGIPFVGAGVLGSAVGMDKDIMKRVLREAGIAIANFCTVHDFERESLLFEQVVTKLGLPFFIKPANAGSSIGVSKVQTREDFDKAVEYAFSYDRKILIEEYIQGREIECSVMGNDHPVASLAGEVRFLEEFNSWDAKYVDNKCEFVIPVPLETATLEHLQATAIKAYRILCCEGMARVDCFLKEDGNILVNEINTIPGFTKLSVFPRLWQASGVSYSQLLDNLIKFAIDRHEKKTALVTSYGF